MQKYKNSLGHIFQLPNGNVKVIGQGGGIGSSGFNYGVYAEFGGEISAGGSGMVDVYGTGGFSAGIGNTGIYVSYPNSKITSSGGNVKVTAQGGGSESSAFNVGVNLIF